jgi:stage II sporulation protein D
VYTITGSGWGHNLGMSQYGALGMAKLGYTYDQIIKFYFTGVTIG